MRLSNLLKATNSFSKNNIIGSERTGTVYKGVIEDGTLLMVTRLLDSQLSDKEFASEVTTLGNMKHRNLVPLLGFCVAKKERLLVYRYMANGNLSDNLHLVDDAKKAMEWSMRIFTPKISDYGLARLMYPIDILYTHLSTFVNYEFGDLDYDAKGDVYSFGIVLLELVTGERPTHVAKAPEGFKGNLVEWITQLSNDGKLQDAINPSLVGKGVDIELFQFLEVACSCVLPPPRERPTMFEVYQLLRAIGERYDFTTEDDEILMPLDTGDPGYLEELIVA
ncbi:hypothetical protein DITRI_Ditri13aG0127800 [Diplodiscus trichospermus]